MARALSCGCDNPRNSSHRSARAVRHSLTLRSIEQLTLVVANRGQPDRPPEDLGCVHAGLALQPMLELLLVLNEQGALAWSVAPFLPALRQRLALLPQQLQVP
jgi:hypothetical protein